MKKIMVLVAALLVGFQVHAVSVTNAGAEAVWVRLSLGGPAGCASSKNTDHERWLEIPANGNKSDAEIKASMPGTLLQPKWECSVVSVDIAKKDDVDPNTKQLKAGITPNSFKTDKKNLVISSDRKLI